MNRIIINHEGVDGYEAMAYVMNVIARGRVSGGGKIYCYATTFADGMVVVADLTRKGSDTFRVEKREEKK